MANGEDTAYHPNRRVDPLTRAGMNLVDAILGRDKVMKLEKLPRSERRKNVKESQTPAAEPKSNFTPPPHPQPTGELSPMPDLTGLVPFKGTIQEFYDQNPTRKK